MKLSNSFFCSAAFSAICENTLHITAVAKPIAAVIKYNKAKEFNSSNKSIILPAENTARSIKRTLPHLFSLCAVTAEKTVLFLTEVEIFHPVHKIAKQGREVIQ